MKTLILARAIIRGTTWFSADGMRELRRRGKLWIVPIAVLGGLIMLGSYQAMIVSMYSGLAAVGEATGHPEILLFYGTLAGWAFMFVAAVPLALSLLYYSRDTRLLMTLPVRPMRIIGSKIALLYLYCIPVHLYLLIPAIVIHALRFGAPAVFWVAALLNLFATPLLPLSLALLLVILLTKMVNLSRFRVALEVAGMTAGILLILCLQVFLSRAMGMSFMGGTGAGFGTFPDLYTPLARFLPPAAWAAESFLADKAAVSGPLILLTSAGMFSAALCLASVNFLRNAMERVEAVRERRAVSGAAGIRGMMRQRTVLGSLVRRELAVLTSNSTFIVQETSELLVVPLLLLIYGLVLPGEILDKVLGFLSTTPLIGPIVLCVLALMTNLSSLSSTSISREGKCFALSLAMPVAGRVQVRAKLAAHMLLVLPAYLLDVAIVMVLFRLPVRMLVFLLPAGPAFELLSFSSGMFFDLKRPILSWTHPQQAVKNNVNSMIGPGVIMAVMIGLAALSAPLLLGGFDPFILCCLVPIVPLVLDAVLLPRVFAYADRQYAGGLEMGG